MFQGNVFNLLASKLEECIDASDRSNKHQFNQRIIYFVSIKHDLLTETQQIIQFVHTLPCRNRHFKIKLYGTVPSSSKLVKKLHWAKLERHTINLQVRAPKLFHLVAYSLYWLEKYQEIKQNLEFREISN